MRRGNKLMLSFIWFINLLSVFDLICLLYFGFCYIQISIGLFETRFAHQMNLSPGWFSHRIVSDRAYRLLVTLYFFRPDSFVQLLSLLPILILLVYILFSLNLVYTGIVAGFESIKSNSLLS